MKKLLALLCLALCALASPTSHAINLGGLQNAHDPGTLTKDGDTWFNFTTGTGIWYSCLLYTSPSPRDGLLSRMPSSA